VCWPLIFTLSKQNPILLAGAAQINTRINLADVCSGKLVAPGGQTRVTFILPKQWAKFARRQRRDRSNLCRLTQLNSINLLFSEVIAVRRGFGAAN
jgi:hypothetical protein